MAKEHKVRKTTEKTITRNHAHQALAAGADPQLFVKHGNFHVRRYAWQKMGRPLPESVDEQNAFLATLQGTPVPKDATQQPAFYLSLRQRILHEMPPFIEAVSVEDTAVQATE